MSAIAVMSVQGLLDCKIVHESVDGDVFLTYLTMLQYIMSKKEEAFFKIKTTMRSLEEMMIQMDDIEMIAHMAFSMINQHDCENWISDSEIYGHIV